MSQPLLHTWLPCSRDKLKYLLIFSSLFVIGAVWYTNEIQTGLLLRDVVAIRLVPLFETKWLYAGLLLITGSFPLIFGFLPNVKFYTVWPRVLLANIPVTIFFILWDVYFTKKGVWGFSENYTTGTQLFGLPWEECLFFMIIPAACTFIYWSLNIVLLREPFARIEKKISIALILMLLGIGFWKWEHIYTSTATMLSALFLLYHLLFMKPGYRGRFYLAYMVSCIPFLLVNGVLTGGFTEGPVVMYNPEEYFGLRVGTVPVDDFAYSFLMLFANITFFEEISKRRKFT